MTSNLYIFPQTTFTTIDPVLQLIINQGIFGTDPLGKLKFKYNDLNGPCMRNAFWVNQAGVFNEFSVEERTINPKQTLDSFFVNWTEILNMASMRFAKMYFGNDPKKVYPAPRDREETIVWKEKFRPLLSEEGRLAYDASLWIVDLTKRDGFLGRKVSNRVKESLSRYGIKDPTILPANVKIIADNVIAAYDSFEAAQLAR